MARGGRRVRFVCLLVAAILVPGLASLIETHASPVNPSPLSAGYFGAPIVEMSADTNGNGLLDEVVLLVPIVVNASGHWLVRGDISLNGVDVSAFDDRILGTGTNTANLTFQGWRLRLGHTNGSYQANLTAAYMDTAEFFQSVYFTHIYAWTDLELRVEMADRLAERPIDADGDSLYNYLEVSGMINVGVPETYVINANLLDVSGSTYITSTGNVSAFPLGYSTYRARFNGDAIRTRGIDGPYRIVVELMLYRDIDALQRESILTRSYVASQFSHNPIRFQGSITDSGIDPNADGKYEAVRLTIPLNVAVAGGYHLFASLRGCFGGVSASKNVTLATGLSNVALDIDGFAIRSSCSDGPYTIDLSVTEDASPYSIFTTYTTRFYSWRDFGNPYGLLGSAFDVWLVDADRDGLAEALQLNATIQATVRTTFEVLFNARIGFFDVLEERYFVTTGPGAVPVRASFPGWRVRSIGYNGTYRFGVGLVVGQAFVDDRSTNGTYTWDQFAPAIDLRAAVSYATPDTDGDGLLNRLDVSFPLHANAAGTYAFRLTATSGASSAETYRYRHVDPGDVTLTLGLSGFLLRSFPGDARLTLWVSLSTNYENQSYSSVPVLQWDGTYAIPDPTVFQVAPATSVTFQMRAPAPLICCGTIYLWNASNALLLRVYPPDTVSLPVINFTASTEGFDSAGNTYAAVVALRTPFPSAVSIYLDPVGGIADLTTLAFRDWSSGAAWLNRTLDNPVNRFYADQNYEPDDVVTATEILNVFLVTPFAMGEPFDVRVDGDPVAVQRSGVDLPSGMGPVVSIEPIGIVQPWSFSVAAEANTIHVVAVNVTRPGLWYLGTRAFRWPSGWVLASHDAPSGVVVSPIGLPVTTVEATQVQEGPFTVNLTVIPLAQAFGEVDGRVVETDAGGSASPIAGATVRLLSDGIVVGEARSGGGGSFAILEVPPGAYTLEVNATGYVARQLDVTVGAFEPALLGDVILTRIAPTGGGPMDLGILLAGGVVAAAVAAIGIIWYLRRDKRTKGGGQVPPEQTQGPPTG